MRTLMHISKMQRRFVPPFHDVNVSLDLMRMKLFPLTFKYKAKTWFSTLKPRSLRSWNDLQTIFF